MILCDDCLSRHEHRRAALTQHHTDGTTHSLCWRCVEALPRPLSRERPAPTHDQETKQ